MLRVNLKQRWIQSKSECDIEQIGNCHKPVATTKTEISWQATVRATFILKYITIAVKDCNKQSNNRMR
jgi:hypothetical protein